MLAGEPYRAGDPEIVADQHAGRAWMAWFNASPALLLAARTALLAEQLGSLGEGATIRSLFHSDHEWNIHLGRNVFLNVNCVILDVMRVTIGDATQIGLEGAEPDSRSPPRCRRAGVGRPIAIGRDVWIGGGARRRRGDPARGHDRR